MVANHNGSEKSENMKEIRLQKCHILDEIMSYVHTLYSSIEKRPTQFLEGKNTQLTAHPNKRPWALGSEKKGKRNYLFINKFLFHFQLKHIL